MLDKVRKTISQISLFHQLVATVSLYAGLDYIYKEYVAKGANTEPLIWALTSTFFIGTIFALLNYCTYAQLILQDEVDRIAKAKSDLENILLNSRRSSVRKKRGK